MSSSQISREAIFGWICLTLGVLAVVLFGAWPQLFPSTSEFEPAVIAIDAETADSLRRAGVLLGTGLRLEELADSDIRLQRAEEIIDGLLESHPQLAEVHRLDGLLSLARGELSEARIAFERCLKIDGRNLGAMLALGASHAAEEDHASAEAVFRRAVEKHPESVEALNNLGQTLWLLDRQDEATEVYRRKIEIQQRSGMMSSAAPAASPATAAEAPEG